MGSACAVTNAYYTIENSVLRNSYMRIFQPVISLLCVFLLTVPPLAAQNAQPGQQSQGFISRVTSNYRPHPVGPVNLSNSSRLEALLRAGILYLSLQDTIALALENNLDIELQRYGAQIADAGILRARAGGLLRGATSGVSQGPSSAPAQAGQATGISTSAASQAGGAGANNGTVISQTGSTIPNLDPVITSFVQVGHATNPQTSTFVTGTNTLVTSNTLANATVSQSFLSGTTVSMGLSNSRLTTTGLRNDLNPSTASTLSLNVTQRLLQGFGPAVNSRNIQIARNNREVSDLVFKQQVINIVSAIIGLYWDLVSFNEVVKVNQQAVDLNQKLLSDNKKQVEIGTLAPIEIVRAEAELATAEQDLTISRTRVLQQETILKNALSRNGVASPSIAEARIVPTDRIQVPQTEAIQPIQDMMAEALRSRPEMSQRRIQIVNDTINLQGSRSQLLPTLDAVVNFSNNALAGDVSTLPLPPGTPPRNVTPYFIGGY